MPIALDRARYFATHLSDNIAETPEGYRLCRNAVIARTGFQTYKVSELIDPDGLLADRAPHEEIEVWRDPAEVFSDATLASFEGKTFTLTHPDNLLDPDSERDHHEGHASNVRRGSEALDTGDFPVLADILVTGRDAIRAIDAGFRELSCGYSYRLAREGYRYDQRDIRGNHIALVQKGRAGAEARINDAAPRKEYDMSIWEKLLGKGFTFAKDAKPEDVAAITRAIVIDESAKEDENPKEKGADADAAMDNRKRMHDMLDEMLTAREEEEKKNKEMKDADLGELKRLLNQTLGEGGQKEGEEKDAADADPHPEGCRCADCMDKGKDGQEHERMERDGAPPMEEKSEDAEIVRAEPVLGEGEKPKSVFDAQLALDVLNHLKPFVARAHDKKLTAAFDTATKSLRARLTQPKTGGGGNYVDFGKAAARLSEQAMDTKDWKPSQTPGEQAAAAADKIYRETMETHRKTVRERTGRR